jgi:hypothetical protein
VPVKKFVAAKAAKRGIKAEFQLEWEDDAEPPVTHTETFYCYPGRTPGATLFDLVSIGMGSAPMWEFYTAVMGDGFSEFEKFVRDPEHGIDADTLREITSFIIEYDTGLPTLPSAT